MSTFFHAREITTVVRERKHHAADVTRPEREDLISSRATARTRSRPLSGFNVDTSDRRSTTSSPFASGTRDGAGLEDLKAKDARDGETMSKSRAGHLDSESSDGKLVGEWLSGIIRTCNGSYR